MSSKSETKKEEMEYSPYAGVSAEERQLIEAALPKQALARPAKPRKLLIFDRTLEFRHAGIPYANLALTLIGEKTGAFNTVVSNDPNVFSKNSLEQYDAILFNDTTGNLFEDPQLRRNLLAFVEGGGGLMALHAAISAFMVKGEDKWPEFGAMLGARPSGHHPEHWASDCWDHLKADGQFGTCYKLNTETIILKTDDPGHPVSRMFDDRRYPVRVQWADEILCFGAPYSRDNIRVLLSVDTNKTMANSFGTAILRTPRDDGSPEQLDFPVAWVKSHGKGRVLYCNFGHNPHVFWHEKLMEFFLASAQFVLGDLPGATAPNPATPLSSPQEPQAEKVAVTRPSPHRLCVAAGYIRMGISGSQGPNTNIVKSTQGVMLARGRSWTWAWAALRCACSWSWTLPSSWTWGWMCGLPARA